MSREIKFRAWDKKDKYYHYDVAIYPNNKVAIKRYNVESMMIESEYGATHWTELGDDTLVEQYTGLKDKNGKEIYEGDILKIGGQLAEVIFDDDKGCYMGEFKINYGGTTIRDRDYFHDFKESREIVGNIHENLELLWGEDGRDK